MEAYHLQRTCFERIAERKVRRRHLTDDGDVEISGLSAQAYLWDIRGAAR